jgi:hypothetical protein
MIKKIALLVVLLMFFGCERDKTIKYKYKSDDITEVERKEIEEMKIRLTPRFICSFVLVSGGSVISVYGRENNMPNVVFWSGFAVVIGGFFIAGVAVLNEFKNNR